MQPVTDDLHSELANESDHLTKSRAALNAMRERAAALTDAGGDGFASEALGLWRQLRVKALTDDGNTPLFFGRTDHNEGTYRDESFYIGRRHVADDSGDPLVVDWRAPVSVAFYRANATDRMGVAFRRRFGYTGGTLTSFEDEHLWRGEVTGSASRILAAEIERPRVGPMRDIVATIQPDQDELVRADLDTNICIQGAPGTGKTAVGLHRAAFLLFTHRDRLRHNGVLVVGPNRAFLGYISQVLPALGEVDVTQLTADELVSTHPIKATDAPAAARVKGDARMADVLQRALWSAVGHPSETLVFSDGATRLRLGPGELARIVDDIRRENLPYLTGRERLCTTIAERYRRQLEHRGESPPDRWVSKVARSKAVKQFADTMWPKIDSAGLLAELLTDPAALAAASEGILTDTEQSVIGWVKPPRSVRSAQWSIADSVLIDEIAALLERPPTFGHVIVDEAQDLSPMQARAIGRRCRQGSVTVLGDLAQGTAVNAANDWQSTLAHLGKPDARIISLTTGYRVPREIVELANRLLPELATGVAPAVSARQAPGSLSLRQVSDLAAGVREATEEARQHEGSIGIIAADHMIPALLDALVDCPVATLTDSEDTSDGQRVMLVPATLAKGLEYDHVLVVEPADIVDAEPRGLHRLYVVLTRAVSRLAVVHTRPLPAAIA